MSDDETGRLIQAIQSNPELVGEFAADLGGDPDTYGSPEKDWATASDADLGRAFVEVFVVHMLELAPTMGGQFADVDLGRVDFSAVGQQVKISLEDPSAWSM
jgi:hypothetical protein